MPSAQDCAERLREQAYRTLLPQIRDLEQELQSVNSSLSSQFEQIQRKLDSLRNIELPTTDLILHEILDEVILRKDLEADNLALFMRNLRQKETQEEILSLLLDTAHQYFSRVALFAVRGDRFVGWSSRGFAASLAGNISSCTFVCTEYPQLQAALESENPVPASGFPEDSPVQLLIDDRPGTWNLVSLQVMQRPVAVLIAGGTDGASAESHVLALMAGLASMRLENIALRILHELTAARPEIVPPVAVHVADSVQDSAVQAESLPPVAAQESIPTQTHVPESAPVVVPDVAPAPEPAVRVPDFPVVAAEDFVAAPIREKAEMPQPVQVPEPPKVELQEVRPIPEEERLHADAKRFARLLVSEIKLYNEKHVVEGRGNQDLYLRLKRDIDRSREMYEKRISPTVSRKIDYFHDEIIRILGDNDPSTLGSDYPGPRVES